MSTYTTSQIRSAILRAADTIERNPRLWNFGNVHIGDCGTPMCAAGWIGFHLKAKAGDTLSMALHGAGMYRAGHMFDAYSSFSRDMNLIDVDWFSGPDRAAKCMRAYADKYFPASAADTTQQIDPAFTAFKAAFARTMESA